MQTCSGGAAVRAAARRVDVQRAAEGLRVFDEMRAAGVAPDATTKALLVKSLWREGKLREAALVEERCEDVWTASAADLKKVLDIDSSCFAQLDLMRAVAIGISLPFLFPF